MERQQVAVADKKMAELVRLVVQVKNGEQVRQVEGLAQVALKKSNGRTRECDESNRLCKA